MSTSRLPVFFISHGGGPWPYVDEMKGQYPKTIQAISQIPLSLPYKPTAALVITGHWEAREFSVSTAEHPPMDYDYYGFPEHTYHIQYPAPGSPALANRVSDLLKLAGISTLEDANRGFDHGTFVPMGLMYPDAEMPVVLLSLKSNYDPAEHIRAGQALQALREEGVLIIGSGLTYHNMRGFGSSGSLAVSQAFEAYLQDAVTADPQDRVKRLEQWQTAPAARDAHPREDHLMPLMVAAGAAGNDAGHLLFTETIMNVVMSSYRFG